MKYTLAIIIATAALIAVAGVGVVRSQTPPIDLCLNIEGVQSEVPAGLIREPSGNCVLAPTPTAVPTATATPVPATPTPVVVTNTVVYRCEGPYSNVAPYALQPWQLVNFGLNVYQYGGAFNWQVPTLVIRTNGLITATVPNAPECMPQSFPGRTVAATATATPAPVAPQIVVVQAAAPTPVVSFPREGPTSSIQPPRTGDGGLVQ
jgi:hypothetical protein